MKGEEEKWNKKQRKTKDSEVIKVELSDHLCAVAHFRRRESDESSIH